MIIYQRLITVTLYLIVTKVTFRSVCSYPSAAFSQLQTLEECPVTLSANRYQYSPKRTVQKLDEKTIQRGLKKFPGIHSHLSHHIETYNILSEKAIASKPDVTKVNTLINIEDIIYSMLNVKSPEEKPERNVKESLLFKCPKRKAIKPCTCSNWNKPTLNCSELNSFVTLKNILNTAEFPSTKFTLFTYYPKTPSEEEAVLLDNTFGPLSFKQIFLGETGLQTIEPNAFNGSQNTLELLMSDGNRELKSFPFDTLNFYNKLSTLTIVKSSIDQIPSLKSSSLKYLDLNTNKLTKLNPDVFATLPSLTMTDLSYNNIENILPNGLFMTSPDIILYLNRNQLKEIGPFTCHQPYLLDESHNSLSTFNQEVYEPILERLAYVDVTSNNIDCSELEWVKQEYQKNVKSECFK